jgi:uncharacterized protein YjiS (DUF1127 family)
MAKTMKLDTYEAHAAFEKAAEMPVAGSLSGILAAPARMLGAWREIRKHRQAMDELRMLDDRMLQDIGVSRSEIPRVARYGRDVF